MDLANLEKLKEILVSSKDLQAVFYYFLDHFGEDEAFLDLGRPVKNELLDTFIHAIAQQLLGTKLTVLSQVLIAVPGTSFIHGGCKINGRPANVLYFDDIKVGMVALMSPKGIGPIQYSRFTARQAMPGEVSSEN